MEGLQYALVDEEGKVLSVLEVPMGQKASWTFPDDRWRLICTDFEFDPINDFAWYRYDEGLGTFVLEMPVEALQGAVANVFEDGTPAQQARLEALIEQAVSARLAELGVGEAGE